MLLLPTIASAKISNPSFYQTIDDDTGQKKSIVALYNYKNAQGDDLLAGRIIALYNLDTGKISETLNNPVRIADKVKGAPKMAGMDILWDMKFDLGDNEYFDGHIMDPKKGKIYRSVIWQDTDSANKLQVRGKIGPFGRTQTWNVLKVSDLPADLQNLNTKNWAPVVIE